MGYYTTVAVDLQISADKKEKFLSKVEEMKSRASEDQHWIWFRYYDDLFLDDESYIQFDENYRKWYDCDEFYNFVKDYVEEGYITGYGDEFEDYWRIVFDGKGGWKMQAPVFVDVE